MATKDTAATAADPRIDQMQDIAALQAQGLRALTGMNTAWFEALSDMGSEVMSFVAERIQEDVKTQHMMLHCRDATELQKIQADFIQTAINQYSDETGKLVEMGQKAFEPPEDGQS